MKRTIGNVAIKNPLVLAPMAGVCDRAFRQICKEHDVGLTVSEMISSRAYGFDDKKTKKMIAPAADELPFSIQIFGNEPLAMARAAERIPSEAPCQILDINMGCPAPKITSNGEGSALMRDIIKAEEIIKAVVAAAAVPVTVKFRLGWNGESINCIDFAKMAEQAGAAAICVHGRTREQMYAGKADWDTIGLVKQAVQIPVMANGDVCEPEDAVAILNHTGADFAMIGRGALGNPFLFPRALCALRGEAVPPLPDFNTRIAVAVRQLELAAEDKGEYIAMLEARKHLMWYIKGTHGGKYFKERISALSKMEALYILCEDMKKAYEMHGPKEDRPI